jgi:hypothetical protein
MPRPARPTNAPPGWRRATSGTGSSSSGRAARPAGGDHAAATREAAAVGADPALAPARLCDVASVYALAAGRAPLVEGHARRAVELLEQAAATLPPADLIKRLKDDPDLDPVRTRPDFQRLLADLAKKTKPSGG